MVGAGCLDRAALGGRRRGADHRRTERLCPLAEQQADAAGCRVKQHDIARPRLAHAFEQHFDRHALEMGRRRDLIVDATRHRDADGGRDVQRLGITAQRAVVDDMLAGLDGAHPAPDALDHAGGLHADAGRQRQRITAGAVADVDEVEADRGMAHPHLAGLRVCQIGGAPFQHARRAWLVDLE